MDNADGEHGFAEIGIFARRIRRASLIHLGET
jgi:hypothetical protein